MMLACDTGDVRQPCRTRAAQRETGAVSRSAKPGPVPYFHVVFTLPSEIAAIAFCNRGIVFDIMFRTVAARFGKSRTVISESPGHRFQ